MPIDQDKNDKFLLILEKSTHDALNRERRKVGFNRSKLVRMMVKYCLSSQEILNAVLQNGDPNPDDVVTILSKQNKNKS